MISEKQFNKTRFSKVMEYHTYRKLDSMVEAMPSPLPIGAQLRTGDRFTATKPTGLLTQIILFWMRQAGIFVYRQNSQGTARRVNGEVRFTPGSKFAKGQADIQGVLNGRSLFIEVKSKSTKDRLSESQKRFRGEVEKAGAIYWEVGMVEDLIHHLETFVGGQISADLDEGGREFHLTR